VAARRIEKTFKSQPTIEGAGVHLKHAFGYNELPLFDPFLLLDDMHSANPDDYLAGFPWHPHRGIETITYMIQGLVEHGDSMGNNGKISGGEAQWMTAGSGIIHQELPAISPTGTMQGFQFWTNLPAALKMMPPRYRDVGAADIPEVTLAGGATVKIISGKVNDVQGPIRDIVTKPELLDVALPAGATFTHPVKPGHTAFAYVIEGKGHFGEFGQTNEAMLHGAETVILYQREGDQVVVQTQNEPARFLFLSGKPLNEPIAWRGPIVMNTSAELSLAFEEFRNGTFVKKN